MNLKVYPLLSTRSKRAMLRVRKKWGHPYYYIPRHQLLVRLSSELGMTQQQVIEQVQEERKFLLKYHQYFV